jgi:hypothetical protein
MIDADGAGTGYSIVLGACLLCGRAFTYNPVLVPSVWVDRDTKVPPDVGGTDVADATREPLCPDCVVVVNMERRRRGTGEIVVLDGAYEPMAGWPE